MKGVARIPDRKCLIYGVALVLRFWWLFRGLLMYVQECGLRVSPIPIWEFPKIRDPNIEP